LGLEDRGGENNFQLITLDSPLFMLSFLKPSSSKQWDEKRILVLIALATLVVSVIWRLPDEAAYLSTRGGELLVALTLALSMTYVLRPVVQFFTRWTGEHPRGRTLATVLAFVLLLGGFYLLFLVGWKPVQSDVKDLIARFWPNTPAERTKLLGDWQRSIQTALSPYRGVVPDAAIDNPKWIPEQLGVVAHRVGGWLGHQTAHLGFIVELLLIPVLAFYFLSDGLSIRHEARILFPQKWRAPLTRMGNQFDHILDSYVRGQVWMCLIAWVLVTIALWALHVPHAMTLGFIAGLTRAIPVIGPLLGAIPILLACLFYTQSVQTTSILLLAFTLMHFLESKVLLPKIVGHHVDLHPVTVIMALLVGLEFFGAMGAVLAVPIAAMVKVLLSEWHDAQEKKLLSAAAIDGNGELSGAQLDNGALTAHEATLTTAPPA